MTRRRRILVVTVGVATMGLAAFQMLRPRALALELATIQRGPLVVTVDEEGTTRLRHHDEVSAPVGGRFLPAAVRVGDSLMRGAVLGTIVPAPLDAETVRLARARMAAAAAAVSAAEATVRTATASHDDASAVYRRREQVAAAGGMSLEELERVRLAATEARDARDAAVATLRAARAELTAAQVALDVRTPREARNATAVRTPVAGVLLHLLEEHDRIVAPGQPLAQVGDPTDLEIVIPVLTDDALRIHRGADVQFTVGAEPRRGRATVQLVEPAAFAKLSPLGVAEQRVNVIARVREAPRGLGDAFQVDARIVVAELHDAVIVAPSALEREGSGWRVWAVRGGRATRRAVLIGHRTLDGVEVIDGVSPGDTVIVYPRETLSPGTRVMRAPGPVR